MYDFKNIPSVLQYLVVGGFSVAVLAFIGYYTNDEDNTQKKPRGQQPSQSQMRFSESSGPSGKEEEILEMLQRGEQLKARGQLEQAERIYKDILSKVENDESMGADHVFGGVACYSLGLLYRQKAEYTKAVEQIQRAIQILEKSGPEAVDQIADALATLSDVFMTMKKYTEAEMPLQRAILILTGKLKLINDFQPRNSEENQEKLEAIEKTGQVIGILYDSMSKLRFEQQRYAEAEDAGKEALRLLIASFGENDSLKAFLTRSVMRLAEIFLAQGKFNEARELYDKILKEQETGEGAYFNYFNFGTLSLKYKALSLAENYLQKAVALLQEYEDKPKECAVLLKSIENLANIATQLKRNDEVATRVAQIQDICQRRRMPAPSTSSLFFTIKAEVKYAVQDSSVLPFMSVSLNLRENVQAPSSSIVVVKYPSETSDGVEVEYPLSSGQPLICESPKLAATLPVKCYIIETILYSDSTRAKELNRDRVFVNHLVDTSLLHSEEDLKTALYDAAVHSN